MLWAGAVAFVVFFLQGPAYVWNLASQLPDAGDSYILAWIHAWPLEAAKSPAASLWDAPIYDPIPRAFTFSESCLGDLLITAPVQLATGNVALASNALRLVSFVLNAVFVFVLVRKMTDDSLAAIIAGIVFAYFPYRQMYASHGQMLPSFWAVWSLFSFHCFVRVPRPRHILGMVLPLWMTFYASVQLGVMFSALLLLLFCVEFAFRREGRARRELLFAPRVFPTILAALLSSAFVLLPLAGPLLQTVDDWGFVRSATDSVPYSTEPAAFLAAWLPQGLAEAFGRWVNGDDSPILRGLVDLRFLGLSPWLFGAAGGWLLLRRNAGLSDSTRADLRTYMAGAVGMGLCMIGPRLIIGDEATEVPMPYALAHHLVPGLSSVRNLVRFNIPMVLCLSVVGGVSLAWIRSRLRGRLRRADALGLGALVCIWLMFDLALPHQPTSASAERVEEYPPVYAYLAESGSGAVLELPVFPSPLAYKYYYYQTGDWRPRLGGVGSFEPPMMRTLKERTSSCPSPACLRFIRDSTAQTLVVHLDGYETDVRREWERVPMARYGFDFRGVMGNSMVWEREGSVPASSSTLSVRGVRRDEEEGDYYLGISLAGASPDRPWRWARSATSPLRVTMQRSGVEAEYVEEVPVPAYLGAADWAEVKVGPLPLPADAAAALAIEGELLDRWEAAAPAGVGERDLSEAKVSLSGDVDIADAGMAWRAGERRPFAIALRNEGRTTLPDEQTGLLGGGESDNGLAVREEWYRSPGEAGCDSPAREPDFVAVHQLAGPIGPGQTGRMRDAVVAPPQGGTFRLRLVPVFGGHELPPSGPFPWCIHVEVSGPSVRARLEGSDIAHPSWSSTCPGTHGAVDSVVSVYVPPPAATALHGLELLSTGSTPGRWVSCSGSGDFWKLWIGETFPAGFGEPEATLRSGGHFFLGFKDNGAIADGSQLVVRGVDASATELFIAAVDRTPLEFERFGTRQLSTSGCVVSAPTGELTARGCERGYAVYGPYVPAPAGALVRAHFRVLGIAGAARLVGDVSAGRGEAVIGTFSAAALLEPGKASELEFELVIPKTVDDLEARLLVEPVESSVDFVVTHASVELGYPPGAGSPLDEPDGEVE